MTTIEAIKAAITTLDQNWPREPQYPPLIVKKWADTLSGYPANVIATAVDYIVENYKWKPVLGDFNQECRDIANRIKAETEIAKLRERQEQRALPAPSAESLAASRTKMQEAWRKVTEKFGVKMEAPE